MYSCSRVGNRWEKSRTSHYSKQWRPWGEIGDEKMRWSVKCEEQKTGTAATSVGTT